MGRYVHAGVGDLRDGKRVWDGQALEFQMVASRLMRALGIKGESYPRAGSVFIAGPALPLHFQ